MAENPRMRSGRRHPPFATLALGLSLWMALPSLEWCPFRWDACTASCTDADVVACGTPLAACEIAGDAACETAGAPSCGSSTATRCAAGPDAASNPPGACDASPDPLPLGDRAYCVHPPVDGLLVAPVALDPPGAAALLATLAPAPSLQPPAFTPAPATAPRLRPPPLADPHAPPNPRAPPAA